MSDKQGWTSGPWQNYELPHNDGLHMGYIRPLDEDGMEIAHHGDMRRAGAVNKANGDLLAAAPTLYAALKFSCPWGEDLPSLLEWLADQRVEAAARDNMVECASVFLRAAATQARAALLQARPEGGQK